MGILVGDKNIFATQGDYGLIQCRKGCHPKTYDAVEMFRQMDQASLVKQVIEECHISSTPNTK